MLSASTVLQGLLAGGKSPLSDQFLRWKLWRFWDQIVGPTVAAACEPVGLDKGGRLLLWVKSSSRLQELRFVSETILKKTNEYLGAEQVRSIRFTLDQNKKPHRSEMPTDLGF